MHLLAVNYHYFRETKPKKGIYPLTIKEFGSQIEILAKEYDFISQEDVMKISSSQVSTKKKCLLTFDDGLKEQMAVFEWLKTKGIPGTFYVTTDAIMNGEVLDVHKVHFIRSVLDDESLLNELLKKFNIDIQNIDEKILQNQYRYDEPDARLLKYILNFILKPDQKKQFIDRQFFDLVGSEDDFSRELYMSKSDVKSISDVGGLGTHCASHAPLGQMSEVCSIADIDRSIVAIEEMTGRKPVSISYPYGGVTAVPNLSDNFYLSRGLYFGLTMTRGVNRFSDINGYFNLKRVDTNDAPGGKSYRKEYLL